MGKMRRDAVKTAVSLTAMSGCGALSTGRCVSAFYAQTGRSSWIGIAVGCVLYGFFIGGIVRMKRKTGAESLHSLYTGMLGKRVGAAFTALHAALLAICTWVLMKSALGAAALMLPVHNAGLIGVVAALMLALMLLRLGLHAVRNCGCICFMLLAAMAVVVVAFGKMPGRDTLHFHVVLKLENSVYAAVLLAAVHASLSAAVCAAGAVRLFPMHAKPRFAGFISAVAMGAMLSAGNLVFCAFPPEINALKSPFAALSDGWGRVGYHICLLVRYAESVISLCGICCMLPGNTR